MARSCRQLREWFWDDADVPSSGVAVRLGQPAAHRLVPIKLDSCPIKTASTVELMPHATIRDANACRIEWNVMRF